MPKERNLNDYYIIINVLAKSALMKKLVDMNLSKDHFEEVIRALAKNIDYQTLNGNQILFREGDKGDKFYIIIKGSMNILKAVPREEKMTGEQYIRTIDKINKEGDTDRFIKIVEANQKIYPIEGKHFDRLNELLFNIKTRKLLLHDNPKIQDINRLCCEHDICPEHFKTLVRNSIQDKAVYKQISIKKKTTVKNINVHIDSIKKINTIAKKSQQPLRTSFLHSENRLSFLNILNVGKGSDDINENEKENSKEDEKSKNNSISSTSSAEAFKTIKSNKMEIDFDFLEFKRKMIEYSELRIGGDIHKYLYILDPKVNTVKLFFNEFKLKLDEGCSFGDTALDSKTNKRY